VAQDPKLSRGYRNCNPGNIDYNPANKWQGQLGIETGVPKPRFARFAAHEYGIRAITALLVNYQDKHGIQTIRGIINRWAPPSENDTGAYVNAVAAKVKVGPDQTIDLHKYVFMRPLVEAIIRHELGGNPYEGTTTIDDGMRLAGIFQVANTVEKAMATKTGTTALGISGATTAAAVAAPVITAMADLPQWVGVTLIIVVAIGVAAYFIFNRMEKA
jgi:hypothetical protein